MARTEADRDDLFAELAACPVRWEFQLTDRSQPVVAGVWPDDRFSVYLRPAESYQFDPDGGLRRAFVDDRLYRSQGTTLAQLVRERSADETVLQRGDLTPEELAEFVTRMRAGLSQLCESLSAGRFQLLRHLPEKSSASAQCLRHLNRVLSAPQVLSPRIGRR